MRVTSSQTELQNDWGACVLSDYARVNSKWCTAAPTAIELVRSLAPGSQELSCFHLVSSEPARQRPTKRNPKPLKQLPAVLLESVLISNDSQIRYLILAISNAIQGLREDATIYLQLAGRSDPKISQLLSHFCIWYAQRDNSLNRQLISLMQDTQALHVQQGPYHLAMGMLHYGIEEWKSTV